MLPGTAERLRQSQVDQVELGHPRLPVLPAAAPDENVFRLEVAVNEARLVVKRLKPGYFRIIIFFELLHSF